MSSSKTSTTSPIQSPISPSKPSPLTSTSSANVNSDLSTSDLIERIPTPILRLLTITSPLIDSIHSLIHLLTWNQSNSKSILLLLSWWSICLFSYELLRFAPQILLLSFISYQGIVKFYSSSKGNRSNPSNGRKIVTNKSINQTLVKLTEITDFFSTLKINLIHPILDLLSWKNNQTTKRFSFFLLTTWPLWLICFLPFNGGNIIPNLWFKIEFSWFGNLISWGWQRIHLLLVDLELKNKAIELLSSKAPHLYNALISFSNSASQIFHSHHVQQVLNFTSSTFKFLISTLFFHNSSNGTSNLSIPLFPPFPFFSLTLRHFFLISGTFILTYCSPWSALIRHSLWKSSLIRRSTRAFIRIFTLQSGSIGGGNQNFNRYLDDDATDLFGLNENARYKAFDDDEIRDLDTKTAKNEKKSQGKSKPVQESKVTRHEDVIYQFSIFENQRWWMGLDWTAALLPQERPSWSDESNNPVSPPSSFSLPSAKISITPSPSNSISSSSKKLFNRRLVKWQWLDPEWTVSGAGFVSSTVYNNATNGSASNSSGYLGDALSRMRATKSAGYEQTSFPSSSSQNTLFSNSQKDETSSTTSTSEREDFINSDVSSVSGAELSVDILDVDSEGWQYGDNSWEKLSKKSGLGRYTRRRKWVRRAVLVEILERDVQLSEKELNNYERENGVSGDGGLIAVGSGNGNDEDEGEDTETENEVEEKVNKLKSNPIDGDIDSNLNENSARKSVDNTVSNSSNANVGAVGIGNSGLNGGNEKRASGDLQSRLAKLTK